MDPSALLGTLLCIVLPFVTSCYLVLCRVAPFRRCGRCAGTGRARRQYGRVSRLCRRCDGVGIRIRFGTHVINEAMRIHREGSR